MHVMQSYIAATLSQRDTIASPVATTVLLLSLLYYRRKPVSAVDYNVYQCLRSSCLFLSPTATLSRWESSRGYFVLLTRSQRSTCHGQYKASILYCRTNSHEISFVHFQLSPQWYTVLPGLDARATIYFSSA